MARGILQFGGIADIQRLISIQSRPFLREFRCIFLIVTWKQATRFRGGMEGCKLWMD